MKIEKNIYILHKQNNGYKISISDKSFSLLKIGTIIAREADSWTEENLIGNIDNSNRFFSTSYPYKANSSEIYYNGLKIEKNIDFNERGNSVIELNFSPLNTENYIDKLIVRYKK